MATPLPTIISANTYFWSPSSSASQRRSNETRRMTEVENFFLQRGFLKISEGNYRKENCVVVFSYSESCKNVYKRFSVAINGKRSNSKGLQKFLTEETNQ